MSASPPIADRTPVRRPSLRRRLLLFLLVPMLALLTIDAVITYRVALAYANHVHDRDLANDALTLATMLQTQPLAGGISPQASFLLQFDPDGHNYFAIRSRQHGLIAGNKRLLAVAHTPRPGQPPQLYDARVAHKTLRVATLAIANPRHRHDVLDITVAETFRGRRQVAGHILMLSITLQLALIAALLLLIWLGVRFGLRVIEPLTRRLARREHDLSPIDDHDVPIELLPLTRTIDGLFARVEELMLLQERFVADAAHQLRTPLAGLRLHIDRALRYSDDPHALEALRHVQRLTDRTSRTSAQLLALTRAQSRPMQMTAVNVSTLLPALAGERVPDAIERGIDLGFETTDENVWIRGDAIALEQALDNLIDNALHYTPADGTVTLSLTRESPEWARLEIQDSGPGVAPAFLKRLGERFFRAPDNPRSGTGLGLAIVRHIVHQHSGTLHFGAAALGGLAVTIRLPRWQDNTPNVKAPGQGGNASAARRY